MAAMGEAEITMPVLAEPSSRVSLLHAIDLGSIRAPNRILMAPMTRSRATLDHVPTPLMATYYAQRASAGLIISEATGISAEGLGWPYAPGLYSAEQIEGWRRVTTRVHDCHGLIFAQLWHMGRLAHPRLCGGLSPVSASATTAPGEAHTYDGKHPHVQARALEIAEISAIVRSYADAARNAMAAGFDGVQIHAASGMLIDQFLRDNSNFRTDAYGGPIANRIRFLIEVTEAVAHAVGPGRTSVRLSPNGASMGVDDSNQDALFTAAAEGLAPIGLAFLELHEVGPHGTLGASTRPQVAPLIRRVFRGPLVLNSDYSQATGQFILESGQADAISYGRPFISNPDLPRRFAEGRPLARDDINTWYGPQEAGYADYPMVDQS